MAIREQEAQDPARPFSAEHSRRVGRIAARIAAQLGMSAEYIETLREAAPLHDVGKLAVPDEILEKPGPLSADERAIVQAHTEWGARMLADGRLPMLQVAAIVAATHHERWDGTGYPAGLEGEEIPLAGRIVGVADVFDALTHDRPYKAAWPVEDALTEIARGSGSQFDPVVVRAFLTLGEEHPWALRAAPERPVLLTAGA